MKVEAICCGSIILFNNILIIEGFLQENLFSPDCLLVATCLVHFVLHQRRFLCDEKDRIAQLQPIFEYFRICSKYRLLRE